MVDLPDPDSPTSPSVSPGRMVKETLCSTCCVTAPVRNAMSTSRTSTGSSSAITPPPGPRCVACSARDGPGRSP
jgi:hypothetical protein